MKNKLITSLSAITLSISSAIVSAQPVSPPGEDERAFISEYTQSSIIDLRFHNGVVESPRDLKKLKKFNKQLAQLQKKYGFELYQGVQISDEKKKRINKKRKKRYMKQLSQGVIKDISESEYDFNAYWQVSLKKQDASKLTELSNELNQLDIVKYAQIIGYPDVDKRKQTVNPLTSMLATDFTHMQGYLYPENGVDVSYAWSKGIYGQGVKAADIEFAWNFDHVEFANQNAIIAPGMQSVERSDDHGTAVMGVVYAADDGKGVTGGMHQVDTFYGIPHTQPFPDGYNINLAYDRALELLDAGDVLMIEVHYKRDIGNQGTRHYVPAEFYDSVFERTQMLSDAGIIVVAAAGNGGQNFDDPRYEERMQKGDSGSILVGAGSSDSFHTRLGFSNHGSRIDLQGWGHNVTTTGYGVLEDAPNADYTNGFNGTSSATPTVANAAIAVVSYMKNEYQITPSAYEVRDILKQTGHQFSSSDVIGALPNIKAAFEHIDATYGDNSLENNVPISVSKPQGSQFFTQIDVPAGAKNLFVETNGGTGDADLYVRYGAKPDTNTYDCAPYENGNNEYCDEVKLGETKAGTYHIMLDAYSAFDNVTLVASYEAPNSGINDICQIQGPIVNTEINVRDPECIDLENGSYYYVYIPAGTNQVTIQTDHGEGNIDLYMSSLGWPSTSDYEHSSTGASNSESITINNPVSGYHYLYIDGQSTPFSLVPSAQ